MSNQQNDTVYEAAFDDFMALFCVSDSFASLIYQIMPEISDEWTKHMTSLRIAFRCLWDNDCELLCRDKRAAIEAYLMYRESIKQLKELHEKTSS